MARRADWGRRGRVQCERRAARDQRASSGARKPVDHSAAAPAPAAVPPQGSSSLLRRCVALLGWREPLVSRPGAPGTREAAAALRLGVDQGGPRSYGSKQSEQQTRTTEKAGGSLTWKTGLDASSAAPARPPAPGGQPGSQVTTLKASSGHHTAAGLAMRTRRITIAVRHWDSEEGIHTWKYCKQHVLQVRQPGPWGRPGRDGGGVGARARSAARRCWRCSSRRQRRSGPVSGAATGRATAPQPKGATPETNRPATLNAPPLRLQPKGTPWNDQLAVNDYPPPHTHTYSPRMAPPGTTS